MLEKSNQKCKSSEVGYTFFNSVSKLPKIDWEEINKEQNILFSIEYLKTIESSLKNVAQFNYIVFFDPEKTPIGFAVTQLIAFNTAELQSQNLPCNLSEGITNSLLNKLDINVLVCGNTFTCGEHHFIFNAEKITASEAYKSLAKALRDTKNMGHSEKPSFILVKEFWPKSYDSSDSIKTEDFSEINIDVNMVLYLKPEWYSFEDYLGAMRTKFRTRAKKALSNSSDIRIKNFSETDIKNHKERIDELYNLIIDNAYFKLGKLSAKIFMSLKEALKDKFVFSGYFLNDNLIGFKTYFVQKDNIEAFHIGFDYDYKKSRNIYQRMLYEYVDIAIKNKVSELRLGRTSETIKSAVGAVPVDMKLYVRHRNSVSNKLLRPLVDFVTPSSNEIRNPFKKIAD